MIVLVLACVLAGVGIVVVMALFGIGGQRMRNRFQERRFGGKSMIDDFDEEQKMIDKYMQ